MPGLDQRLVCDVGEDQRSVLVLTGPCRGLDDRRRRILAELGVDGAEHGECVDDDLVGGEGDQRAAVHRVVGDDRGHVTVVIGQHGGDLAGGEDEPAGVCRMISIGSPSASCKSRAGRSQRHRCQCSARAGSRAATSSPGGEST